MISNDSSDGIPVCGRGMPRTPPTSSPSNVIHRLQDCCSIPKAKTNSSNRIKAAVMAGATKAYYRRHNKHDKHRRHRVNKRQRRLTGMFLPCTPVPVGVYCWTEKQLLDQYCVVIDGSAVGNRTCITPKVARWNWRPSVFNMAIYLFPRYHHSILGWFTAHHDCLLLKVVLRTDYSLDVRLWNKLTCSWVNHEWMSCVMH